MRKLLILTAIAGLASFVIRRKQRGPAGVDLTQPHLDDPQTPIERMEREADIPGGVHP